MSGFPSKCTLLLFSSDRLTNKVVRNTKCFRKVFLWYICVFVCVYVSVYRIERENTQIVYYSPYICSDTCDLIHYSLVHHTHIHSLLFRKTNLMKRPSLIHNLVSLSLWLQHKVNSSKCVTIYPGTDKHVKV